MKNGDVTLSVVSHGQEELVSGLLTDVKRDLSGTPVVLTHNLPAQTPSMDVSLCLQNEEPKGFGANHNAAFRHSVTPFFGVVNPDIRLTSNPLPSLIKCFEDPRVGLVAPRVVDSNGNTEDSARHFPTISNLVAKAILGRRGVYDSLDGQPLQVDWVAGMFMIFRAEAFSEIGGFDDEFFLYYEDVDICARLWQAGWKVVLDPGVSVIHDGQRSSHRDLKYTRMHAKSMMRYFWKYSGGASRKLLSSE